MFAQYSTQALLDRLVDIVELRDTLLNVDDENKAQENGLLDESFQITVELESRGVML